MEIPNDDNNKHLNSDLTGKICAIVVTYNRRELLMECLKAIRLQSYLPKMILIVDNSSSDGTPELLRDHRIIEQVPPGELTVPWITKKSVEDLSFVSEAEPRTGIEILYVRMPTNCGGAGGFYEGQRRAFDLGFDWLWLMDDDGVPDPSCLETLLHKANLNELKAANPLIVDRDNIAKLAFGLDPQIILTEDAVSAQNSNGLILMKANPFNGTLLHRDVVQSVGFIKKEMFIWGDETEYFLRMESRGILFATVVGARFFHPKSKTSFKTKMFGLLKIVSKPEQLVMNFYRNQAFINRHYRKGLFAHKGACKILMFYLLEGKVKEAITFIRYYLDGYLGKFRLPALR